MMTSEVAISGGKIYELWNELADNNTILNQR